MLVAAFVLADPVGPSITQKGNTTSSGSGVSTIENDASSIGGNIIYLDLTVRQQNPHYKAYVGNVTGNYVLEDSANFSIYEWTLSSITGEVYATRTSSSITWGNVQCANLTHVLDEMSEMHHNLTNTRDDGINDTFDDDNSSHWGFWAGAKQINANDCNFSINTYVNDSAQSVADPSNIFEEVLLYDGSSNLLYVGKIEENLGGYRNATDTFDFQMIVAENGSPADSQTDYYFFVELS